MSETITLTDQDLMNLTNIRKVSGDRDVGLVVTDAIVLLAYAISAARQGFGFGSLDPTMGVFNGTTNDTMNAARPVAKPVLNG